ncbi:MAG: bifunctional metallophosphatase/5'-nucleotidase [Bacteroidales bacterium]|nr:bifunctional metallophosphatase/5'-nucleotidase [Bacteroidales bacterium]
MMKRVLFLLLLWLLPWRGTAQEALHVVTTGDVHGCFFPDSYVGGGLRPSLMSVKWYVDSLRAAVGEDAVVLLDAGDCLQGDNAAYYYNYVAVDEPHVYPLLAKEMGYDACVLGNHDIEASHAVYDRVNDQMRALGIPWLAGNAFTPSGGLYFPEYALLQKGRLKVLVLGYDNANIAGWLDEELWRGMRFASLVPLVQRRVNRLRAALKPDVVLVVVHSGTGSGDGSSLESQGLDIFKSLKGVQVLVCAHDHRPYVASKPGCCLLNGGARAGYVGHAVIRLQGRRVREVSAETVRLDKRKVDTALCRRFRTQFEAVKAFTNRKVGVLEPSLRTRDAYRGMCDYVNLLHTVQLGVPGVQVSFAAPLTYDGQVRGGELVFHDMFTIYPFENQLFVLRLKGSEIRACLEYSYDNWIRYDGRHVLRIQDKPDARTGAPRWSFEQRSYNFDSAGGLCYTVDVTKPAGSRIRILSMADGTPFSEDAWYQVAMTSYRANGGGGIIEAGTGLKDASGRIVSRHKEIRDFILDFIGSRAAVRAADIRNSRVIGHWQFVPEAVAAPLLDADMRLLFP